MSTQPKFTPGPWRMSRGAGGEPFSVEAATRTIALVRTCRGQAVSNANLIASAPDLYAACLKALTCASIDSSVREVIRAALAKADGATD